MVKVHLPDHPGDTRRPCGGKADRPWRPLRRSMLAVAAIVGLALAGCGDASPDRAAVTSAGARILDETTADVRRRPPRLDERAHPAAVRLAVEVARRREHTHRASTTTRSVARRPSSPPPTLTARARSGGAVRYRDTAWLVEGGRSYGVMTVAAGRAHPRRRGRSATLPSASRTAIPGARCRDRQRGTPNTRRSRCARRSPGPASTCISAATPIKSIWLVITGDAAYRRLQRG